MRADRPAPGAPTPATLPNLKFVIVTLDNHLAGAVERARASLASDMPGLDLVLHAAADFASDPAALARTKADIASADIVLATMLFMDDHIRAVLPDLTARRDHCDAVVCAMSAAEVVKLTRIGDLRMDQDPKGPMALLKKLKGKSSGAAGGASQMAMLRRLPKILKYIPGKAQDLRAYFLTLQYWLAGSDENVAELVRFLVGRYAAGPRLGYRSGVKAAAPVEYPEVGVYHPALPERITEDEHRLPRRAAGPTKGRVGLLVLRSYVLAGDAAHYDAVIDAFEARGLEVVPAFASGLDARPAIERYFFTDGAPAIDALVSLTGFSLVGGPAYNDAAAAEAVLAKLDAPYLAAHPLEFQTLEAWAANDAGLSPVESTIMVAIPELDGATSPTVYGGRSAGTGEPCSGCDKHCVFPHGGGAAQMRGCAERAAELAARVEKLVALRRSARAERRVGVVLFNFPPNAGAAGTAAYLAVFQSLHRLLGAMAGAGYAVDVPRDVEALRAAVLEGNAARYGAEANVAAIVPVDDHVRRERHLADIERTWGPAPGRAQATARGVQVLGARFGNVFVGLQPAFGTEGDPMKLLFAKGFAPTHAFSAFYRWLREDFAAHAVVHFGTHGALEFMPGKHVGLSAQCWPERMIGDVPNLYLYAVNNPSEGAIAKRRSHATLISYLTPPIARGGLYKGLADLRGTVDRWRATPPANLSERAALEGAILAQARALDLAAVAADDERAPTPAQIDAIRARLAEVEAALIPEGLHVLGAPPSEAERRDMLEAALDARSEVVAVPAAALEALARGADARRAIAACGRAISSVERTVIDELAVLAQGLANDGEIPALLHALDGGYVRPSPGGDVLRTPAALPTGRNLHGFDPFRVPSAFALADGAAQAQKVLDRHLASGAAFPKTIALVLWGSDNLKSEGAAIGQALALLGAAPRFDSYGRLAGARLLPLSELRRPRVDVVMTLSGIFRDLLPLQTKLLAEAALHAARAEDEPESLNPIRAHALAHMAATGCDLETAALRVFSNAEGAYGANVNQLIDGSVWSNEDELADAYEARKSFAYGVSGRPTQARGALQAILARVDLAYQNLDSVELGVTTIDQYVDTLGGIARAVKRAKGADAPVYISDQTQGAGSVRTLADQVALETRSRTLNPRWYEGMLKHGAEGVRQIEAQVTNTLGWSATTGEVDPWVYQRITETFVLDPEMRERLASLNPKACARVANRLLEAHERQFWTPDPETLAALRAAGDDLEDRLEGVPAVAA